MKKFILFFSILLITLSSCEKEKQQFDPNAMIKIRPGAGVQLRSDNPNHLTALEIVEQTYNMQFINLALNTDDPVTRGFAQVQRDYETPLLKMWGTDIIRQDGSYESDFIESKDVVLLRWILIRKDADGDKIFVADPFNLSFNDIIQWGDIVKDDTIGYIPNRIIEKARHEIKSAYDNGNYDKVYKMFDDTFVFYPTTGAEYKVLKEQNLN